MSKVHFGIYPVEKDCYIVEIGKSEDTEPNCWGPGIRDRYMIHFCLSGEGTFNGQKVTANNYFLVTPFTKINYKANPSNKWQYLWIIMGGNNCKSLLKEYGFITETGVGVYNYTDKLKQLIDFIFPENAPPMNSDTITYWVKMIFSYNQTEGKTYSHKNVKKKHLEDAVHFINLKYHSGITPSDVAKHVKLDEKYLCSIFKANYGVSIQQYLNTLRIEKSKHLLLNSDLNISEIAYSVGIDDPLYFSRFFRKAVGESPKYFKKNNLKNLEDDNDTK